MIRARILALADADDPAGLAAGAEAIFWGSAGTRDFAEQAARDAYRDLWFARYMAHAPEAFLVALEPDGAVAGYLAGSLASDAPPLPGPDYYALFPRALLARYPAHIHVNVRSDARGRGIGGALVRAFGRRFPDAGGMHAVTAAGSRAAAFFGRCGLAPGARGEWRDRHLVMLVGDMPRP